MSAGIERNRNGSAALLSDDGVEFESFRWWEVLKCCAPTVVCQSGWNADRKSEDAEKERCDEFHRDYL